MMKVGVLDDYQHALEGTAAIEGPKGKLPGAVNPKAVQKRKASR